MCYYDIINRILPNRLFSFYHDKKNLEVIMNLYLAGGENKSWLSAMESAKTNKALYSYFYLNKHHGDKEEKVDNFLSKVEMNIFLDSGGYSAKTKGVNIDIDEYINFIKKYEKQIQTYAVLDVIGDFEKTMENQIYMEDCGVNPLPVFHYGGELSNLELLCSKYDYIALGGLVPYARQKKELKNWLDKCFSVIGTETKIHGFGMTGIDILLRYPFYSVDSTSWLGGSMRAEIQKNINGKLVTQYCNDYGNIDIDSFLYVDLPESKKWLERVIYNAKTWSEMEELVTKIWEMRGIIWK